MGLLKSLFGSVAEKALSQVKDAIANATQQQNQYRIFFYKTK